MTHRDNTTPEPDIESMFLLGEGRVSRGLERFRLADGARLRAAPMAAILAAVTWLPLLCLAAVEGVAWGTHVDVPFLRDFLPYGQFLIAVPTLLVGEAVVGRRLGWVAAELRRSNVLAPVDTPALDALLARAVGLWRGRAVNAVLVILTCAVTVLSLWGAQEWLTGGWQVVGERTTLPGWWYLLFSLPVMRFLALRWLWRLLLWTWVLWRTAQLHLQPQPAHPDRAGGLAFLGSAQAAFGMFVFAFGVQLSCLIADSVFFGGADLMAFKLHVVVFVLIVVIVLLLPLAPFSAKLVRVREEKLVFLSGSGHQGAEHLEQKLIADRSRDLPADDISGLADFGALYENARLMRPLPLELRHVFSLVLAALLPFFPLVFLVMPAQEVFRTLANLLL
jgi:hypothetical protein